MSETSEIWDRFFVGSKYEAKWRGWRSPELVETAKRFLNPTPDYQTDTFWNSCLNDEVRRLGT